MRMKKQRNGGLCTYLINNKGDFKMFDELLFDEDFMDLKEKYGDCIGIDDEDLIQILEGGLD